MKIIFKTRYNIRLLGQKFYLEIEYFLNLRSWNLKSINVRWNKSFHIRHKKLDTTMILPSMKITQISLGKLKNHPNSISVTYFTLKCGLIPSMTTTSNMSMISISLDSWTQCRHTKVNMSAEGKRVARTIIRNFNT